MMQKKLVMVRCRMDQWHKVDVGRVEIQLEEGLTLRPEAASGGRCFAREGGACDGVNALCHPAQTALTPRR